MPYFSGKNGSQTAKSRVSINLTNIEEDTYNKEVFDVIYDKLDLFRRSDEVGLDSDMEERLLNLQSSLMKKEKVELSHDTDNEDIIRAFKSCEHHFTAVEKTGLNRVLNTIMRAR